MFRVHINEIGEAPLQRRHHSSDIAILQWQSCNLVELLRGIGIFQYRYRQGKVRCISAAVAGSCAPSSLKVPPMVQQSRPVAQPDSGVRRRCMMEPTSISMRKDASHTINRVRGVFRFDVTLP
jgi:hypothetical protein